MNEHIVGTLVVLQFPFSSEGGENELSNSEKLTV